MASLLKELGVYEQVVMKPIDIHGVYSGKLNRVVKVLIKFEYYP